MPKFRDTILLAHASRLINAEEFVLLYDLHKPKNPDLPYTNYECFDLDKMTDDECKTEFRFYKNDFTTWQRCLLYRIGSFATMV